MPKLGMEPIRRQQFIEATIQIIHEEGLERTTLARVARQAGASAGLVAHYFGDKATLLHATFRHLTLSPRPPACARRTGCPPPAARPPR